jgi:hypothetical protein
MDILKDRRVILALGAALALAAGLIAAAVMTSRTGAGGAAPPASQGGLVVQTGRDDDIKLDPRRPLRCFVGGKFAGELPLGECAKRNGVATGALDVGLDPSGALAASGEAGVGLTPLPPQAVTSLNPAPPSPEELAQSQTQAPRPDVATPPAAPGGCLRYGLHGWSRLAGQASLSACVQALFDGRCVRPGAAEYGRWGERTLRLMPGRVEISSDNRTFRTLVEQAPDCALPAVG